MFLWVHMSDFKSTLALYFNQVALLYFKEKVQNKYSTFHSMRWPRVNFTNKIWALISQQFTQAIILITISTFPDAYFFFLNHLNIGLGSAQVLLSILVIQSEDKQRTRQPNKHPLKISQRRHIFKRVPRRHMGGYFQI